MLTSDEAFDLFAQTNVHKQIQAVCLCLLGVKNVLCQAVVSSTETLTARPETKILPKHKENPDVGGKNGGIHVRNSGRAGRCTFLQRPRGILSSAKSVIDLARRTDNPHGLGQRHCRPVEKPPTRRATLPPSCNFGEMKKVTWLSQPVHAHPLATVVLFDYDYLVTKKTLEENDNVADFC